MRLLVTNDDGYLALGIQTLAAAAASLGTVDVVAPDREQSATSHSLTMHHPLRARIAQSGVHVVDGTPTDCVMLAVAELVERPDVVLSGINHGPNLGDDVLYSGTVAAAMEATILGIPAIALSYASREPERIEEWQDVVTRLLGRILRREDDFPPETLLNVNLPPIPPSEVKGVRVTTLGRREYVDSLQKGKDPNGREYFWIGGGSSRWWGRDDSDFRALESGYISVTPLHLDLTNHALVQEITSWGLEL